MPAIKSRNWSQEEDLILTEIVLTYYKTNKYTWNNIADLMSQRFQGFRKTGKQCRQRWTNQLDPDVKGNSEWSQTQNQILFKSHEEYGNKWAQISASLPGRTDNCVKNHFYSTLRKGLRKINNYIQVIKKKNNLIKTLKNEILNKILLLSEGKSDDKFQFNPTAKKLSLDIKRSLIIISLATEDTPNLIQIKQEAFSMITQFSRNCRKKKSRKAKEVFMESDQDIADQNCQSVNSIHEEPEGFPLSSIANHKFITGLSMSNPLNHSNSETNYKKIKRMESLETNKSQDVAQKIQKFNSQLEHLSVDSKVKTKVQKQKNSVMNQEGMLPSHSHLSEIFPIQSKDKGSSFLKARSGFSAFRPVQLEDEVNKTRNKNSWILQVDNECQHKQTDQNLIPLFNLFLESNFFHPYVNSENKLPKTSTELPQNEQKRSF